MKLTFFTSPLVPIILVGMCAFFNPVLVHAQSITGNAYVCSNTDTGGTCWWEDGQDALGQLTYLLTTAYQENQTSEDCFNDGGSDSCQYIPPPQSSSDNLGTLNYVLCGNSGGWLSAEFFYACSSAPNDCGQTSDGTIDGNDPNLTCSAGTPPDPDGYGSSCSSSPNSCGQTNSGSIQCDGSCSASAPADPGNLGASCTSAANSCGQTNSGSIQCDGSCSASAPADPGNLGQSCSSSANACGQTQANGTYQCDGSCSSTPPALPGNYGQSCTSSGNACGQTQANGTYQCDGSCSSTPPPDSNCPVASASFNGPPSCTIAAGSSGCNAPISWTSANVSSVNLTDSGDGLYGTFPSGAQSSTIYIPYNSGTYNIRKTDNTILATVSGTSSCIAGSSWNGSTCSYPSIVASCSVVPTSAATNAYVTWSATASGGTGTGYTYSWTGTNLAGETTRSFQTSYTSGGTYSGAVTVMDSGGDSSGSVACTNGGGGQPGGGGSVSITPAPSCSNFSPSPSSIVLGDSTTLNWSCQNVTSCSAVANGDGFSTSGETCSGGTCSGSSPAKPSSSGQVSYALDCTGPSAPSGIDIDSSPITVLPPNAYITAIPSRIAPNGSTEISWSAHNIIGTCSVAGTDGYSSGTLTPSGGTIATGTPVTRTLVNPATYTITCPSQKLSSSVTVNVTPGEQEF